MSEGISAGQPWGSGQQRGGERSTDGNDVSRDMRTGSPACNDGSSRGGVLVPTSTAHSPHSREGVLQALRGALGHLLIALLITLLDERAGARMVLFVCFLSGDSVVRSVLYLTGPVVTSVFQERGGGCSTRAICVLNGRTVVRFLSEVLRRPVTAYCERVSPYFALGCRFLGGDRVVRFLLEVTRCFVLSPFLELFLAFQRRKECISTLDRLMGLHIADAYYLYGLLEANGCPEHGIEQSNESAATHFEQVAERHEASRLLLGCWYVFGIGRTRSLSQALKYFKPNGSSNASLLFNYSLLLYNGVDGVRDVDEARRNFEQLADRGYPAAKEVWAKLSSVPAASGAPQTGDEPTQDSAHIELPIEQYLVVPEFDFPSRDPSGFDRAVADAAHEVELVQRHLTMKE